MINIKHVDSKKGGPVGQFSLPGSKLNLPIDTIFPWSLHTSLASRALRSRFARAWQIAAERISAAPAAPAPRYWAWTVVKLGLRDENGMFTIFRWVWKKKYVTNVLPET